MDNNLKSLISISHFKKIGPIRLATLRKTYSNWEEIYKANYRDLIKAGLSENLAYELDDYRQKFNIDNELKKYEQENIKFCTIDDCNYPKLLKEIHDPPPILYCKGNIDCLNNHSLAVVGSRKFTGYGRQICEDIVFNLAKNKLVIVSGLALGIDALAHFSALNAKGITVGVLGSGVNESSIYPVTNRKLANKIINNKGAIVSEFPFGTIAFRQNFPQRNRVIAGLTKGTLVVEADIKSGSLITANFANDSGRDIFAVPGNIFASTARGTNKLINDGAKLVTCAEDILNELDIPDIKLNIENVKIIPENNNEKDILTSITKTPIHINEIIQRSKLDTCTINSTLIIMEMKGMIKNTGNMNYILK